MANLSRRSFLKGLAAVAGTALAGEMMIHLRIERAFGQCLLQRIQQATLLKGCCGIAASQQLIQ